MPKITDQILREMQPPAKGNRVVWDEGEKDCVTGFGLRITSTGARAFVLRYVFDDPKAERRSSEYRYTIGSYPAWSVTAARDEAKKWRRKIDRRETHPMAERQEGRRAVAAMKAAETYSEAVEDYIKREQEGRRQNATASEVKRSLLRDGAEWADRPVAVITPAEIRKLLETMRDGDEKANPPVEARPYLANRLHSYLSGFFRWCAEPGIDKVKMSPMLGLRRPWEGETARDRVYSDDELKAIWRAADQIGGISGAFLKVKLLSGKRRGALSAMKWSELSDDGVWSPAVDSRLKKKTKRLHGIPLPKLAQRIVAGIKPAADAQYSSEYVFAGRVRGSHIFAGSQLLADVREKSGVGDFIFHGLRHTVETRMAELGVLPHIRDMVMDHAPARGSGAIYDHHHYRDEKLAALEKWADHVESVVVAQGVKVLR